MDESGLAGECQAIADSEDDIDQTRLNTFALQANLTARRILGLLMDIAGMEWKRTGSWIR